ncbi:unnamed protein product [Peniophora sp. CBMAI 1063]|nr:unnamed protein product [Peniophora sp. CBMAI 1063]
MEDAERIDRAEMMPKELRKPAHSFQATLVQFPGFASLSKPRPCYINAIPSELLMEVLVYLPSVMDAYTRVHIDPLMLPSDDEGSGDEVDEDDSDDDSDEDFTHDTICEAEAQEGYGDCLAERHHRRGCLLFCSQRRWNYLNVLRVCKTWQAIALSCPAFWTTIAKHNAHTVELSLRLSGNLPLYLNADTTPWPSVNSLLRSLNHLPRIRTLSLSSGSRDAHVVHAIPYLNDYFMSYSAALLEELRLDFSNRGMPSWLTTTNWVQRTFPVLKVLDLNYISLSGTCTLLSHSLTELSLTRCVAPWETTAELLDVLHSLPLLVHLTIAEMDHPPDLGADDPPSLANIVLPVRMRHLRSLGLQGPTLCISRLLTMTETPLTMDLDLKYEHRAIPPAAAVEIGHTYAVFDLIGNAMPDDAYFKDITLFINLAERSIEFSFGCLKNPSNRPCTEEMTHLHTWSMVEDTIFPSTWAFTQRIAAPFLPRITHVEEISMGIILHRYTTGAAISLSLPPKCFSSVLDVTGLTYLLLEFDAAMEFLPWIVRLMYDVTATDGFHSSAELKSTPSPLPNLSKLKLADCNMACLMPLNNLYLSAPSDTLFSYLWLFLHAKKPITHLMNVKISNAMMAEVHRLLGARLELDYCDLWEPEELTQVAVRLAADCSEELIVTANEWGWGQHTKSIVVPGSDIRDPMPSS